MNKMNMPSIKITFFLVALNFVPHDRDVRATSSAIYLTSYSFSNCSDICIFSIFL